MIKVVSLLSVAIVAAASGGMQHGDPIAGVLLSLAVILVAAKLSGDLATRIGQPAVLGEMIAGILLGNLCLAGFNSLEFIKHDVTVDMLARLGVIILLFEVGLESTVAQMMKVGLSSFLVATVGVALPFALGWGVGALLLPGHSVYVHIFIGATLTATSVGITARVLKDLKREKSVEARIILGAAVIDDVMGLIILSVVTGVIMAASSGMAVSAWAVFAIILKAIVFLAGALVLGVYLSPLFFRIASKLRGGSVLLAAGLAFCFTLSWLADLAGLAPIVGAFAAGLILEDLHYKDFTGRGEHGLEELIKPVSSFLVPVFFVLMGMRTDLSVFGSGEVLLLAAALTAAAIIGKQACSFGAIGKGLDRLSVGIGMIPRGEVGLIFANIGMGLAVAGEAIINKTTYSAVVVMVILTTLVTPPALKWSMSRHNDRKQP
ncbi:MAG: cation:proton antiporter [Myxococcota bacterium]|jgi:Kef-type K+ transport system membrane component KefB